MSDRTRILLAFVGFALFFSVITLVFWGFMRDTILIPVYYVLWIVGLMLNSVPQGAYLAILVILSAVIGLKIFESLHSAQRPPRAVRNQPPPNTRYVLWSILCTCAPGNWFSKNRLALEARKLVLAILAYEQGIDTTEVETLVRLGKLDLPDAIRNIIQNKAIPDAPWSSRLSDRLSGTLDRLRHPFRSAETPPDPYVEHLLAELISFVEYHLEITHAGQNPDA